jgi:hypothetical protein
MPEQRPPAGRIGVASRAHEVYLEQIEAGGKSIGSFLTPEVAEAIAMELMKAAVQARRSKLGTS